jgi:RND family efflux transporter MFP subunit
MMAQQAGVKSSLHHKPGRRPVLVFFAVLAVIIGAAIAAGIVPRLSRQKGLLAASQAVSERKPVVTATPARFASSKDVIDLPGDMQAMIETPIFARADGYLKKRYVDLGDHVAAGQPMADIETPELDQQISQARASLAQSQSTIKELEADLALTRANLNLARVTRDRWQTLVERGVMSRQDGDEKQADFAVKEAQAQKAEATLHTAQDTIHASDANLKRLEELKSFARVTAPHNGIVTSRLVDIGTLINSGNGGASKEMFRVASIQPMRIFVNVPQAYVAAVQPGQRAELRVAERPGKVFSARINRISNALDPNSRAMLAILLTPNEDSTLLPGMYAQVRFVAANARPALRIPGDALILGKNGPRVAVVGADHIVHFRNVEVGQDFGSEVEIIKGLSSSEMVISNPTDAVHENTSVDIRTP